MTIPITFCSQCAQVPTAVSFSAPQQFLHLHHFFECEPDEFLTFHYHICLTCHQLWHEYHSSYNQDRGWHWVSISWGEFWRRYSDELPMALEKVEAMCIEWALAQVRPYDASPPFHL